MIIYSLTKGRLCYAQLFSLIFLIDFLALGGIIPLIFSVSLLAASLFMHVDENSGLLKKSLLEVDESLLTVIPVVSLYAYMTYNDSDPTTRMIVVLLVYMVLFTVTRLFQRAYAKAYENEKDIDSDK